MMGVKVDGTTTAATRVRARALMFIARTQREDLVPIMHSLHTLKKSSKMIGQLTATELVLQF